MKKKQKRKEERMLDFELILEPEEAKAHIGISSNLSQPF